jgi:hypothetical protein
MARLVATSAWTAVLALSVSSGCSSEVSPQTTGAGGAGSGASASNAGSSVASSAMAGPTAVASSSGAGGSAAFVCDPPAEPGSIFELSAESLDVEQIDPVSMCKYRGDVMLIVNTAAV